MGTSTHNIAHARVDSAARRELTLLNGRSDSHRLVLSRRLLVEYVPLASFRFSVH